MDDKGYSNENPTEVWLKELPAGNGIEEKEEPEVSVKGRGGRLRKTADNFADKTSLHGVNFMRKASSKLSLIFFVGVFLICTGMTISQVGDIIHKYLEYPTDTKIILTYEKLPFPTVTICNMNPLRKSKLQLDFDMQVALCNFESLSGLSIGYSDIVELLQIVNTTLPESVLQKLKGFATTNEDKFCKDVKSDMDRYSSAVERISRKVGGMFDDDENDTLLRDVSFETHLRRQFLALVSSIESDIRLAMGHQLRESLISCSFNGFECDYRDFDVLLNGDFGNCFAFNSPILKVEPFLSRQPGPVAGLVLELYNQHHEYLKRFAGGSGFRVSIHPFDTLAFPLESGLSISTGESTDIGMRMVNISRLGGDYGECEDDEEYIKKFGILYTTAMCQAVNREHDIMSNCNCMRPALGWFYPDGVNFTDCSETPEMVGCVRRQIKRSLNNYYKCHPACREISYEFIVSQYSYPELQQWAHLVKRVCRGDKFGEGCLGFLNVQVPTNASLLETYVTTNNQRRKLRANFAQLRVYFTDLNYELIQQEPSYDTTHLGGDIGGALSLWFGMSVFTGVELITFFFSLFVTYANTGRKRK